jgi:hypothetical protein
MIPSSSLPRTAAYNRHTGYAWRQARAVLRDLSFNVLRQSGLADANRAANRLTTRAGAARDLIQ